mgnify:CR=1 FL=1
MAERSTKPYLIRAIHEWACDSGLTPYISVKVDENTRVPAEHVRNGEIVLNLSYDATHKLTITNDLVQFAARFSGVSRECWVTERFRPLDEYRRHVRRVSLAMLPRKPRL